MEWNINDVTEQAALNAQSMVQQWKEATKKRLFGGGGKKPNKHDTKSFSRTDIQNNKKRFLAQLKEAIKKHPEFNTPQWIQYFTTIADVETGGTFNENATSKTSSARGYFQILKPNRSTSNQFEDMFALTKQNQRALLAGLGKDGITKVMQNYTIPEIMALSHFQGANGAIKIFRGNKGVKDANGVSPYKYLNVFRNKIKNKKPVATIEENTNTSINSDLPFMETPLTALQIAQEYNGVTPQTPVSTPMIAEELEIPEINVIPDVAKKELLRKAISQTLGLQTSIPQTSKIAFNPRVFIDGINSEIINEEQQNLQNILLQDAINRNVSNSAFRYALANDAQEEIGKQDQEIEIPQILNQTALGGPLFNSRTPIESFQGKKSSLPVVRYDEGGNLNIYNAKELPEINIVGNNKPAIIMYDKNTGEYRRDSTGDILTPINTSISDNPADWTYQDKNGTLFTPHRQVSQGEITQGREQNGLDKILQFSNQHYNDPIIGAAARWSNDWHNDRNPVKAGLNYFDPTGLIEYGLNKGIDLYNERRNAFGTEDAIIAGLTLLPFANGTQIKNIGKRFNYFNPTSQLNTNIRTHIANDKVPYGYVLADKDNYMPFIKGLYDTVRNKNTPLLSIEDKISSKPWYRAKKKLAGENGGQGYDEDMIHNREAAFRETLGLDDLSQYPITTNSGNKTFYVRNNKDNHLFNLSLEEEDQLSLLNNYIEYGGTQLRDGIIGNHGGMGHNLQIDPTGRFGKLSVEDTFDLMPLQSMPFLPKTLQNIEVSSILPGYKPFHTKFNDIYFGIDNETPYIMNAQEFNYAVNNPDQYGSQFDNIQNFLNNNRGNPEKSITTKADRGIFQSEFNEHSQGGHLFHIVNRNLPKIIVTGKKKAEGGNLFQDGGNTLLTQNLPGIVVTRPYPSEQQIKQTIEKEWPSAVGLPQYRITKDPTFTRERTGAGSIEYFNEPSITYRNGTTVQNPNQEPTLLFDPNTNTVEDIKLDLLHHYREYDKEYQKLLLDYTNALIGNKHTASDLFWNSELGEQYRNKYGKDIEKHWDEWDQMVEENINNNQYLTQAIDGSLRSLMASDALREKSNYDTKEGAEASWLKDKYAKRAYNNIIKYLKTSKK